MQLIGIKPGDDWNPDHEQLLLAPHLLYQAATPCDWDLDDGLYKWNWTFTPTHTIAQVGRKSDYLSVFYKAYPPSCVTELPNGNYDPWMRIAYDGIAKITWDLEGLE